MEEINETEKKENETIHKEKEIVHHTNTGSLDEDIEKRKKKFKNRFFNWVKDDYDKIFILIVIAAFIIRFLIFLKTTGQPIWWDAGDYLATAKQWGLGLDVGDNWYYRRGYFWPLFGSIIFRLGFGEVGLRFTEVLFSTGLVIIAYFLIKEMFNKQAALLVSIFMTFSWIILFFTGRPLTSIPSSFFLLVSLLFFWKGYILQKGDKFLYLFILFLVIAIMTRMQFLMFLPCFIIIIFLKEKFKMFKNKKLWLMLGFFFLLFTPWIIMYSNHYGNFFTDMGAYYLGISSEGHVANPHLGTSSLLIYFKNLPYILNGEVTSIFYKLPFWFFIGGLFYFFADLVLGFDKIFKNANVQKKFFTFLWIAIPFVALAYVAPHLEQRYIMATLPFVFLIPSIFILKIKSMVSNNSNKKIVNILVIVALIFILIPNFSFAHRLIDSKKTSYFEVQQAGLWLKENTDPDDVIFSSSEHQLIYYSERKVVSAVGEGGRNKTAFEERIRELKPDYLLLSVLEWYPEWAYSYPQEHNQSLIPVKVYSQNDQPVLIIYEFLNHDV